MPITFTRDPELTPDLREGIARLWTDVSNAGGAVGFVPPVTVEDIRPELDKHAAAIAGGRMRLLVGYAAGQPVATAFVGFNTHRLMGHWAWLYTVMVAPALQGTGHGGELMRQAEAFARDLGFEALRLTCRGGLGLERFYASAGYKEVGRVPSAIRVAPDDDRDDVIMWLPLA